MTRKEEIEKAMKESVCETVYSSGYGFTPQATDLLECAFTKGAEWADKTMLDRACEWLNNILYIHTEIEEDKDWGETNPINWVTSDYDTVGEFITAFRQAMKGE